MMTTATIGSRIPGGLDGRPGTLRKWAALAAGMAIVWVFIFVIAPALQKNEMVQPLAEYVRESGIEASALYYTGVEETGEAEAYLRDAFAYAPAGP
jgi:hypothetical protein